MSNTPDYSDLFASLDAAVATTPVAPKAPLTTNAAVNPALVALSAALDTTAPVTVTGMTRPFQPHQGAAYQYVQGSLARWGTALVGDDMGLGKTQVALAAIADAVRTGGYALVIAPPVTAGSWRNDITAAFPHLRFAQISGRKVTLGAATGDVILPDADVYFLSDDPLTMRAWLTHGLDAQKKFTLSNVATNARMIVRDEIHRDKGAMGKPGTPTSRARLMLTIGEAVRTRNIPIIGLTGTILTNRPIEALIPLQVLGGLPLVKAVTPGARNAMAFAFRYTNPVNNGYGYTYNGCDISRMHELHDLLRSTVYVRREKSDLGAALPHSGWIVNPIALNGVLTRYRRLEKEFLSVVLEEDGPEAMWRKARAEAITRMQAMWEEAGTAKAAASVEYIADLVDQGRPVVCFYYHNAAFHALSKGLLARKISTLVINGQVTGDRREETVNAFQAGQAQVLLAQVKAAGIGVTLTHAADAVFVQVPWSAGDLKQAADRILRTDDISRQRALDGGQVTWHVLQAAHTNGDPTFDMAMWDILERKALVCDAVNAGREITMPSDSIMQQALTQWYAQATGNGLALRP